MFRFVILYILEYLIVTLVRFVLLLLLFNFVTHCIISTVVVAFEINYLILSWCRSPGSLCLHRRRPHHCLSNSVTVCQRTQLDMVYCVGRWQYRCTDRCNDTPLVQEWTIGQMLLQKQTPKQARLPLIHLLRNKNHKLNTCKCQIYVIPRDLHIKFINCLFLLEVNVTFNSNRLGPI